VFHRESLRQTLSFSLNLSGARLAWYLYDNSDKLIIGRYLGEQVLGYYTLATRLTTELSGRVLSIINQVAFPVYARLQDEPVKMKNYFLTSVQLAMVVLMPVLAGLSLVSADLIPLLLKPKWMPMIPALNIMCWAAVLLLLHSVPGPVLTAKGEAGTVMRYSLLSLAVMPVSFYLASRHGLEWVCAMWLIVFPVVGGLWIGAVKRSVEFSWVEYWQALQPAVLATAAMVSVLLGLREWVLATLEPGLRTAGLIVAGIGVYWGCLKLFFPQPLQQLREFVRRKPSAPVLAVT
jgi:PST family polysaccharide transporter